MEPRGFFLLLGTDRPKKLQHVQALAERLCIGLLDRHDVNGPEVRAAEFVALCRQLPAVGMARLIVVDHAEGLTAETINALLPHAKTIATTACVVFLVERELGVRHPLARAAHDGVVDVTRFAGREAPPPKPFALTDALGSGDVAGSLQAIRDQLMLGKEAVEVMGLLAWQVGRWMAVRRLMDAGYSAPRIAALTGMRAWQVERVRAEVAGRSVRVLREALTRCWQLEADVKRGRTLPWLALEQLVIELCETGRVKRAGRVTST